MSNELMNLVREMRHSGEKVGWMRVRNWADQLEAYARATAPPTTAAKMPEASRASAPDDRKDAERYRWLRAMRDPDLCVRGDEQRTRGYEPDYYRAAITEMALDAAIDAAMQENHNG